MTTKDLDKARREYSDRGYQQSHDQRAFNPHSGRVRDHWKRAFHGYFEHAFAGRTTRGKGLVEVGAGRSTLLPYFALEFGFDVVGLDYAEMGCRITRENLSRAGVNGEAVCAEVFSAPADRLDRADVVASFGGGGAIRRSGRLHPLMRAAAAPRRAHDHDRSKHEGLHWCLATDARPARLREARGARCGRACERHTGAGMRVLDSRYVLFLNLAVVNISETATGLGHRVRSPALAGLRAATVRVWLAERTLGALAGNSFTSPYAFCLAEKPSRQDTR